MSTNEPVTPAVVRGTDAAPKPIPEAVGQPATIDAPDDARGVLAQCVKELRGQIGSVAGEAVARVANTLEQLATTL